MIVGYTVTSKVQADMFPAASVAVQDTVVLPRGKKLPEGGTQTTDGVGSQLSLAVTEKFTNSPGTPPLESITKKLPGHAIVGGIMSPAGPAVSLISMLIDVK